MINRDAVRHVYGTDVYSTDGDRIGSAGQVYLDNDTGDPAWVAVRTGLFGKKESFVPVRDATLDGGRLEVPFSKDKVKHAPRIDHDRELSPDDEDELFRYYQSTPDGQDHDEPDARDTSDHARDTSDRPRDAEDRPRDAEDRPRDAEDRPAAHDPEMTLRAERPVVTTEAVPVERVRRRKLTAAGTETAGGEVRKEHIALETEHDGGHEQRSS